MKNVIYTEEADCRDCYRCVRSCPVKSIKIENQAASVMPSLCIYCGRCIKVCPAGAKKYRDDRPVLSDLLMSGKKVVAAIAPSVLAEFEKESVLPFLKALYLAGFSAVSETAIAADRVSEATSAFLNGPDVNVLIGTCCPTVVNYIRIYYPELKRYLAPVASPMVVHARMIKALPEFADASVVFISPCVSKKRESDIYGGIFDSVITFSELFSFFETEGIDLNMASRADLPGDFILGSSRIAGLFPVDGGMIKTMNSDADTVDAGYMSFSGMYSVMDICRDIPRLDSAGKKLFLEMTACQGGCVKGPEAADGASVAVKRARLIDNYAFFRTLPHRNVDFPEVPMSDSEYDIPYRMKCSYSEEEIRSLLESIGKKSKSDELNCSGCGYDNCREFAKALAEGKAEREMCVSQMRKEAQSQASALLAKMPYGVVLVDKDLRLINANEKFVEQGGEELRLLADTLGSLVGADLRKLVPYHKYFMSAFGDDDVHEYEVKNGPSLVKLSIIPVVSNKILCGIIRNMDDSATLRESVSEKVGEVLAINAEMVKDIASILGESAAKMESILKTIAEK